MAPQDVRTPRDADAPTATIRERSDEVDERPSRPVLGPTVLRGQQLEVSDVIGVGGMGVVYRAEQTDLQRPIAFKRLGDAVSDEMRARFVREARLTARLDHPNIVPVHLLDVGSSDVPSGYAMKLVEGNTLATVIREARELAKRGVPLDSDRALDTRLEIFLKICDAIAFAHDRGIIHRDLKPSNVMIGAFGAVYVMDWGIARPIGRDELDEASSSAAPTNATSPPGAASNVTAAASAARAASDTDHTITQAGMVIGSARYMSPEQARGENATLDARSDQYSLGLLLQELVSLEPATHGPTEEVALTLARKGDRQPFDRVDGTVQRVPPELRAIVARATAFDRDRRYATTRALADDVRRWLHGEAVDALPERWFARFWRFVNRHRRATLIALGFVVVAGALAFTWTRYRHVQSELATRERGARLTALYREVARQASRIDRDMFRMEEGLEGLSRAAEWALDAPVPASDAPLYFDTDYLDPARRPADFSSETAYRWPVSLDQLVIGVAPGIDRSSAAWTDTVLPKIRRIAPLVGHIREMVVAATRENERPRVAAAADRPARSADEIRAILRDRKSPIDYAYVDLAEGIHIMWPGIDSLPPDYDVRTSWFYTMSEHKRGKRWGAPYADSTTDSAGDDLVLPCTQGLWSKSGAFLGVAGVEITVTKMVETSMVLPTRTVLRTSLVDDRGRVVVDSRDANKRFQTSGKDEAVAFVDLDLPDVAAAIRSGEEGLRETTRAGRDATPIVVAFTRLDSIGWYYVVEVEATSLGASARR